MAGTAFALEQQLNIHGITTLTAAGNYTVTNDGIVIVKKTVPAITTITLPVHPSAGQHVIVKDGAGNANSFNITVVPDGVSATTIDGAASFVMSQNYVAAIFEFNGTEWGTIAYNSVTNGIINYLSGITPGTAAASKAVVLDGSLNVTGVNNFTTTGIASLFALTLNDVASINAAGTVIANAAQLAHTVNIVAGANDAKGVILPATAVGEVVIVYSSQATNGLLVYPPVNSSINGGSANASINIEGKSMAIFVGLTTTNWGAIYTLNA